MRRARILGFDVRFQFRYGFYFLYLMVSLAYIAILSFIPAPYVRWAASIIILSDPAALGFFFVGGMLLLEKGEGLHDYWAILPASTRDYVWAKALSLAMISSLVGALIAGVVLRHDVNYPLLLMGLVIGASIFTCFGIVVGSMARSVNHFFFLGVPVGAFLMGPTFLVFLESSPPAIEILPATLLFRVIIGALGLATPYPVAWAFIGLAVWCVPAFLLADGAFARSITRGGGEVS